MNIRNIYRYLRYILRGCRPNLAILDISNTCNAQCLFCPRVYMAKDRRNGYMTKTTLEGVIVWLKHLHIQQVRLYSVGEPLLNPDFEYIIRRLKEEHLTIAVSTNGTRLLQHKEALMQVDYLQISINGWDNTSYDYLHGTVRFKELYDQLREYADYNHEHHGSEITINMLMTPHTDLNLFLTLWGPYVDHIKIHPLTGTTAYDGTQFYTTYPGGQHNYFPSYHDDTNGCMYPYDVLTISYDGKLGLCCEDFNTNILDINIIDDGIKPYRHSELLRSLRHGFFNRTPTLCHGCNRFNKPHPESIKIIQNKINRVSNNPYKEKLEPCL